MKLFKSLNKAFYLDKKGTRKTKNFQKFFDKEIYFTLQCSRHNKIIRQTFEIYLYGKVNLNPNIGRKIVQTGSKILLIATCIPSP